MTAVIPTTSRPGKRADAHYVLRKLSDLINGLRPGDRVPNHPELMVELQASERAILSALNALHREGRLVRRPGLGTYVAEPNSASALDSPFGSLTAASSRTVVSIAKPDNSFFDRCMDMLFREVEAENLDLICRVVDPSGKKTFSLPTAAERPLGFIVFRHDLLSLAQQLQADGNRVVLMGAPAHEGDVDVPNIYNSHEHGGYLAAQQLIELGHRTIALHYTEYDQRQKSRSRGHQRAVRDAERAGVPINTVIITNEQIADWKRSPEQTRLYFDTPNAPTAIAAWNDHEALGILAAVQRAGLRVPDDLSLIGYDALPEGNMIHPALTTIDQSVGHQLRIALDLLTGAVAPKPSQSVMVMPTLLQRSSTAPYHVRV